MLIGVSRRTVGGGMFVGRRWRPSSVMGTSVLLLSYVALRAVLCLSIRTTTPTANLDALLAQARSRNSCSELISLWEGQKRSRGDPELQSFRRVYNVMKEDRPDVGSTLKILRIFLRGDLRRTHGFITCSFDKLQRTFLMKVALLGLDEVLDHQFFDTVMKTEPYAVDLQGNNVIHLAVKGGSTNSLELLLRDLPATLRTALLRATNLAGETPLAIAAKNGRVEMNTVLKGRHGMETLAEKFMENALKDEPEEQQRNIPVKTPGILSQKAPSLPMASRQQPQLSSLVPPQPAAAAAASQHGAAAAGVPQSFPLILSPVTTAAATSQQASWQYVPSPLREGDEAIGRQAMSVPPPLPPAASQL